jgi:hypothetical protein
MRYSEIDAVDNAVQGLIACMRANPYAPSAKVERGVLTLRDVFERIKSRYGMDAAMSVRITVH